MYHNKRYKVKIIVAMPMPNIKGLDKEYLYFYSFYILLGAINLGKSLLIRRLFRRPRCDDAGN